MTYSTYLRSFIRCLRQLPFRSVAENRCENTDIWPETQRGQKANYWVNEVQMSVVSAHLKFISPINMFGMSESAD